MDNIVLPNNNDKQPSITLMGDSFAMTLLKNNLAAERTRARVGGIVIILIMLSWLLSMYMIFSYFANSSSVIIGDTSQTAENNGTNNSINQRG